MLRQLPFRIRLLLILSAFAIVPAIAVTIGWAVGVGKALPLFGGAAAWEQVAASGTRVFDSLRAEPLSASQRAALAVTSLGDRSR